jgi:hypothetical protein
MLQTLQTVLMSIEERLRALDTLYSPRLTPRWEISIEQQSRRMETIESRLGRLETLLELRLDKLSEVCVISGFRRGVRDSLFCDVTQRRFVVIDVSGQPNGPETWQPTTNLLCVTSQISEDRRGNLTLPLHTEQRRGCQRAGYWNTWQ